MSRCHTFHSSVAGLARIALVLISMAAAVSRAAVVIDRPAAVTIERQGPAAEELILAEDLLRRNLALLYRDAAAPVGNAAPPVQLVLQADALVWHDLPRLEGNDPSAIDACVITIADGAQPRITIHGATVLATCYGVMDFLEQELGMTWLFPGELGLALPESRRFELSPGSRRIVPMISSRLYTGLRYGNSADRLAFRQKFGKSPLMDQRYFFEAEDYFKSLRLHFLASPSHNMINIFPVEETQREHPELMPMLDDGSRFVPPAQHGKDQRSFQSWHPCYTHPRAVEIAIAKAKAAFDGGEFCYSLGINDGRRVQCQCAACKAIGWPASYYQFVSQVADALKDRYPPHLLGVLVYGDVRYPADDLRLPANVLCMVSGPSALTLWSKHAQNLGRYEYAFGMGFYLPSFPLAALKHNAQVYRRASVRSFRAEIGPLWAFDAPKVYVLSKMLWNLNLDLDAALAHWCAAGFGPAGDAVRDYYQLWAKQWDYLAENRGDDPAQLCDMSVWRSTSAQFGRMPASVFNAAEQHLQRAAELVQTQPQRARLTMLRTHFDLSHTQAKVYHLVQQAFAQATTDDPAGVRQLFTQVRGLRQRMDELQAVIGNHPQWTEGGGTKQDLEAYATLDHEIYSAMLTALLRLRATDNFSDQDAATLPDGMRPLATARLRSPVPARPEALDKGWYWAGESVQHMFEPMRVQVEQNVLTARKLEPTPIIAEGNQAGNYEQHWAFSLIPYQPKLPARSLLKFKLRVEGQRGVLNVYLGNLWRYEEGDHLPANLTVVLDEPGVREFEVVVEPYSPDAAHAGRASSIRFGLLFTPRAEDAACTVRAEVNTIVAEAEM